MHDEWLTPRAGVATASLQRVSRGARATRHVPTLPEPGATGVGSGRDRHPAYMEGAEYRAIKAAHKLTWPEIARICDVASTTPYGWSAKTNYVPGVRAELLRAWVASQAR